jgi:hypothetical protein
MNTSRTNYATQRVGANCGQNASGGSVGIVYTGCGAAYNVTVSNLDSLTTVSQAQGTVTSVSILVIIIGLLIGVISLLGFAGRKESF